MLIGVPSIVRFTAHPAHRGSPQRRSAHLNESGRSARATRPSLDVPDRTLPARTSQRRGRVKKEAFPILPACDPQGFKGGHSPPEAATPRLFQRCRW